jgi:hypothetical protein
MPTAHVFAGKACSARVTLLCADRSHVPTFEVPPRSVVVFDAGVSRGNGARSALGSHTTVTATNFGCSVRGV